jgi:hypothetical protein
LGSEASRGAALAAALGVLLALGVAISLTELFVAPGYRPMAIQLMSAVILLVALARVRAIVAAAVERREAWGVRALGEGWPDRHAVDTRLARVRDEIRFSARSQSYFEHLLWPRLVALAAIRGGSPARLEKPPGRRLGLGPSMAALDRVIAALEDSR